MYPTNPYFHAVHPPMNYPYFPVSPYAHQAYSGYRSYPYASSFSMRQQPVTGQASWTDGGQVTKCNIPWSANEYMTAAVGAASPYQCGQTLKIRNISAQSPKEILVQVVDTVPGYPANKLNLHRRAFQALGATLDQGVINIEIIPSPEVETIEWGRYLLTISQAAYPGYQVTDYQFIDSTEVSANQTRRTYEFTLKSPQEQMKVQANVTFNPNTNRVISFDLNEV